MGAGYKNPPWSFKGRALYQLQLVKAKEARKHVPEPLKMVECFGYTLGGLYLARYDDSPAGEFDEMVVLAGLVWNPPTSCAWANRVLVSSPLARSHGRQECGLPSHCVQFQQQSTQASPPPNPKKFGAVAGSAHHANVCKSSSRPKLCWWAESGSRAANTPGGLVRISNDYTTVELGVPEVPPPGQWRGPSIRMSLPSFSGLTSWQPALLKYSLDMRARVRPSPPVVVLPSGNDASQKRLGDAIGRSRNADSEPYSNRDLFQLFAGKPLLTIAFDDLNMLVGAPQVVQKPNPSSPLRKKAITATG
mmetsp:Transcript_20742/g.39442  ORF Transcript_20742/g.39442 Transcript_20742/m.39442 type:complete len:305 (+) Transcript_20742:198-1112(+)|eukprot:CAMPEP_0114238060 /NCGR_PEP_ID=MMETSP0058-20121206/7724_1 /TAXON_ID=36894 /ORGANISM="Pyramimonas parkeae, CCMP726" /LENGTH=304 /DNA_ID=CAMNT_0001350147 /DNA_START=114 /DNA_END=1028 /DNA_ORIENTATION=-